MPDPHDRASGSPRARPVRSTSAPPGPRCSTSCTPGTSAARSCSASRTRTSRAARSSSSRTSSTASTGSGITWDEGPDVAGGRRRRPARAVPPDAAPRRRYAEAAERLLAADLAYPCYCTPEELDADRKAQEAAKQPPRYVGRCAHLTPEERAAREAEGRRGALRFRVGRGGRRLRRPRPRPRRVRHRATSAATS